MRRKRKAVPAWRIRQRAASIVCNCPAYDHPHRWAGGACKCDRWVRLFFDPHRVECRGCVNRDGFECQVVDGVEAAFHCPELREFIRYEGVQLFGAMREQFERSTKGKQRRAA